MKPTQLVLITAFLSALAAPMPARAQGEPVDAPVTPGGQTPGTSAPEAPTPAANTPAPPVPTAPEPAQPTPPPPAPPATSPPVAASGVAVPAPTPSKKTAEKATSSRAPATQPLLGLAIATPDTGAPPGRLTPSYGVAPRSASDWRLDFHGYLNVPLRVGIGERKHASKTQYKTVFHGPPLAADDYERWEHTGLVPQPWVQLGFSYGNSAVVATVIIAARGVSDATSFFDPPTELGINDAFVTFKPKIPGMALNLDVGAFANRYGSLGEYDTGRYDTPVIARVAGVGYAAHAQVPVTDSLVLLAEQGITGQWDRAPLGVAPSGWNGFTDSNVGTSFAHHEHLGLALPGVGQVGLHYADAFTQDDRTAPDQADGNIAVFGLDVRGELGAFGRFTLAGARTNADHARGVSGVIRVLNTFGGPGLMREYFGPQSGGSGTLSTAGAQYDVSIGEIVRGSSPFSGYGPDVIVSAFGMVTHVTSHDKSTYVRDPATGRVLLNQPGGKRVYDGVDKLKYGIEGVYSMLSWFAAGARYDRVVASTSDPDETLAAITPRLIFRSDYNSQDQVTLSYTHWFYGNGVILRPNYRELDDPSAVPDTDTFSLSATMWW